jgi:hypothetical protein
MSRASFRELSAAEVLLQLRPLEISVALLIALSSTIAFWSKSRSRTAPASLANELS